MLTKCTLIIQLCNLYGIRKGRIMIYNELRHYEINNVQPKSLEISPAVGDFYGTEIEILADCTGPKFGQHRDHLHCTAK